MATVGAAIRKWTALREALPALFREVLEENKAVLLRANKEQLRRGLTSEGGKFRKYKSEAYARKKNAMNPLAGLGQPDLELTGGYLRGFDLIVSGNVVSFFSSDFKAPLLALRFNEDLIFGTSDESRNRLVREILRPALIRKVKQFLQS